MARNPNQMSLRMQRIGERTRRAVFQVLQQGGQIIADDAARRIYEGPKTGRIYRSRWRRNALHQASAAGQAPAADSGRLAQSLTWVGHPATATVDVGTATPYAVHLELGTVHIEPRPSLGPAFRAAVPRITTAIGVAIRRAAREGR